MQNIEMTISRAVSAEELWMVMFLDTEGRWMAAGTGPSAAAAIRRARESLVWALCKPVPFGARR